MSIINRDNLLITLTNACFVAAVIALQATSWRGSRPTFGVTRKFALCVLAIGLTSTSASVLLFVTMIFDPQALVGAPFATAWMVLLLSALVAPALVTIQVIVVVESIVTTRVERHARPWHLAALLSFSGWVAEIGRAHV